MKDILYQQFSSHNLATYPACIQNLMQSHRIISFRKAKKLKPVKLVLAFPHNEALADISQSISPQRVNLYYDHILYFDSMLLDVIKSGTEVEWVKEIYNFIDKDNRERQSPAPKGIHVQLTRELEQLVWQCIASWFEAEQCYWLKKTE